MNKSLTQLRSELNDAQATAWADLTKAPAAIAAHVAYKNRLVENLWIRTESNTLIGPYPTLALANAKLSERKAQGRNDKGVERATAEAALASHS